MVSDIPKIQQLLASPHIENCQLALLILEGMGLSIKDLLHNTPLHPESNTHPLCHNHSYTIDLGILSIQYKYITKRYEEAGFYQYICRIVREVRTPIRSYKTKQQLRRFNRILKEEYGSPYAISEQQFKTLITTDYNSSMIDKISQFFQTEFY